MDQFGAQHSELRVNQELPDDDHARRVVKRRLLISSVETSNQNLLGFVNAVKTTEVAAEPEMMSFRRRIPLWIDQCKAFQAARQTWCRSRPCCAMSFAFDVPTPPPRDGVVPCWHRMKKEEKCRFKRWIQKQDADRKLLSDKFLHCLDHPEVTATRNKLPSELFRNATTMAGMRIQQVISQMFESGALPCGEKKFASCGESKPENIENKVPGPLFTDDEGSSRTDVLKSYIVFRQPGGVRRWPVIYGVGGKGKSSTIPLTRLSSLIPAGCQSHSDPCGETIFAACGKEDLEVDAGKTDDPCRNSDECPPNVKIYVRTIAPRQAGVPNISWLENQRRWRLGYQVGGKRKHESFPVDKKFLARGNFEVGVNVALKTAVARRQELAKNGLISRRANSKPNLPNDCRSSMVGVDYCRTRRRWMVLLKTPQGRKYKYFQCQGDSTNEIERTRLLAEAHAKEHSEQCGLEVKHTVVEVTKKLDEEEIQIDPPGKMRYLAWAAFLRSWTVTFTVGRKIRKFYFRCQSTDPQGIETTRLRAMKFRASALEIRNGMPKNKPTKILAKINALPR